MALWLAQDQGIMAKHGLDFDLQAANATVASKMLVAGQIDATMVGGPESITARAAGAPIRVVLVMTPVYNHDFATRADIASIDQLKDKKVGVPTVASLNGAGTIGALRLYNLEPKRDYTLIETGSNGAQQAVAAQLLGGNIDAAAFDPTPARVAGSNPGFHVIVDDRVRKLPLASASLAFQESFLQQHPDVVQKAVDGLMDTIQFAETHKPEMEQILKKQMQLPDKDLDSGYEDLMSTWARVPAPKAEQFTPIVEALSTASPELKNVDLNVLLDPSFVEKGAANLGIAAK
jgi:ABC-type nitrate/sulfonate/bicarbonate transport system substrate-binding protein